MISSIRDGDEREIALAGFCGSGGWLAVEPLASPQFFDALGASKLDHQPPLFIVAICMPLGFDRNLSNQVPTVRNDLRGCLTGPEGLPGRVDRGLIASTFSRRQVTVRRSSSENLRITVVGIPEAR